MQKNNKKNNEFKLAYPTKWPVRFGMSREEIRSTVELPYHAFTKDAGFSNILTDSFVGLGMHVYYDNANTVIGVELLTHPNQCKVTINGENLLGRPIDQATRLIQDSGLFELIRSEDGFESIDSAVRLYVPDFDEKSNAPIEAIYLDLTHSAQRAKQG